MNDFDYIACKQFSVRLPHPAKPYVKLDVLKETAAKQSVEAMSPLIDVLEQVCRKGDIEYVPVSIPKEHLQKFKDWAMQFFKPASECPNQISPLMQWSVSLKNFSGHLKPSELFGAFGS